MKILWAFFLGNSLEGSKVGRFESCGCFETVEGVERDWLEG